MIINNTMVDFMYDEIEQTRETSRISFTRGQFRNWCHTLNVLSGVNYMRQMLGEDRIEDYKIPGSLSDMVIPRKISHKEGDVYIDLRGASYGYYCQEVERYEMQDAHILDAVTFNRVSKGIAASRRKQDNVTMEGLNVGSSATTISNVESRLANLSCGYQNSMVVASVTNFVPIDFTINFMEEGFYTQDPVHVFRRWFTGALNAMK